VGQIESKEKIIVELGTKMRRVESENNLVIQLSEDYRSELEIPEVQVTDGSSGKKENIRE
jgi:hypothetical protein